MKNPIARLLIIIMELNPAELSVFGAFIGLIFCDDLTNKQINSFGNFLELVGQFMLTYGAQRSYLDDQNKPASTMDDIEKLKIFFDKKITDIDNLIRDLKLK